MLLLILASQAGFAAALKEDGYHVFPGENIQDAVEAAARNLTNKTVKVHAGEYRPNSKRQALVWFHHKHDGVRLEAVGRVTLTAANAELSDPKSHSHPAVVNHVIYFGDGISTNTMLKGFRITGANNFVTRAATRQIEPNEELSKTLFFYNDGGGIKIFGRSYPTIIGVEVSDNYTSPCGAGISIEHGGQTQEFVLLQNCVFRNNRTQVTGAAVDLLPPGSAARIVNCLFVGNISNMGADVVAKSSGEKPFTNSGVLTIFPNSRAVVENCTFTANRNAVDDMANATVYRNSIFWKNDRDRGLGGTKRYEVEIKDRARADGCFFGGGIIDPNGCISKTNNTLDNAASPVFDDDYIPRMSEFGNAGYRPDAMQKEFLRGTKK